MKQLMGATGIFFAAMTAFVHAETLPVFGSWDCEIMDFTLDTDTYLVSGYKMKVKSVGKVDDDAYVAEMVDGYRIGMFEVTSNSLVWHSTESGDTFECKRTK